MFTNKKLESLDLSVCGFTIIELIVTILIIAIITVFSIPPATQSMLKIGIESAANQFIGIVSFARTEAFRSGYPVYLCGAEIDSNHNLTSNGCNTNWNHGVLLFQDMTTSGIYNSTSSEKIRFLRFDSGLNITTVESSLQFSSSGVIVNNGNSLFCIGKSYPTLGKAYSVQIKVNNYGAYQTCVKDNNAICNGC